jgi:hypothetical protein
VVDVNNKFWKPCTKYFSLGFEVFGPEVQKIEEIDFELKS